MLDGDCFLGVLGCAPETSDTERSEDEKKKQVRLSLESMVLMTVSGAR